eukprot:CAMPEP_0172594008 /NCGR_PEP_ID=MMETSP1068-20121228/13264_1 /TAXON_ID=35684 /ORGANISM="Pseudopedinella elastica, Strain CCMP716" /LENGTH=338 /DNA_ID=CAMNT_0013391771 /DNA_START=164 /DNA_END=1183 /DNA_ORIENTATION=-
MAVTTGLFVRPVKSVRGTRVAVASLSNRVDAAAFAEAVALPKRLSPSSITTWNQCPLKFRFKYIEKRPEPTSTALARGIAAHEALQNIFERPRDERSGTKGKATLHDLFRAAWSKMRKEPRYAELFAGDREGERAWGLESLEHLGNYFALEDPSSVEPMAREKWFSTRLEAGPGLQDGAAGHSVELVGQVDRLDRDPTTGLISVVDYKTGKAPDVAKYSPKTQARILNEKFFQLKVYAMLIDRAFGEVPGELRLLYLASGDDVRLGGQQALAAAREAEGEVLATWAEMRAAAAQGAFEPKTGPLCGWCHFKSECPAFATENEGTSASALPEDAGLPPF